MTSTDTFINCPGTCFHDYIVPTAGVSLHATPSASSTFTGWTNCTTPSGNNCTMNVNGVKSVTATFQSSDSTPPTAAMAEPHLAFNIGKRIALVWSGNDDKGSGVATFDVRMRKAKFNTHTFGSFTNVAGLQGTASTSAIFTAAPGFTYCSVRATDNTANTGSYSGQKCTMVPVDDKAMTHFVELDATEQCVGRLSGHDLQAIDTRQDDDPRGRARQAARSVGHRVLGMRKGQAHVRREAYAISLANATTAHGLFYTTPPYATVKAGTVTIKITSATGHLVQIDGLLTIIKGTIPPLSAAHRMVRLQ